jgi:mannose PTS system EIIA component
MIGFLIIAHGTLGESLIHCASHCMGKRPLRLRAVGVTVHDEPDAILPQCRELVRQLDEGDGVLIFADICGATPCNIATRMLEPGKVELITGVNLPMLLRALTYREKPLATVLQKALSGGQDGVLHMTPSNQDQCDATEGH